MISEHRYPSIPLKLNLFLVSQKTFAFHFSFGFRVQGKSKPVADYYIISFSASFSSLPRTSYRNGGNDIGMGVARVHRNHVGNSRGMHTTSPIMVEIGRCCSRPRHSQKQQTSSSPRNIELAQLQMNANVSTEPPKYPGT